MEQSPFASLMAPQEQCLCAERQTSKSKIYSQVKNGNVPNLFVVLSPQDDLPQTFGYLSN